MNDLKSTIFLGQVEDNKDPEKRGRCKIRVFNIHGEKTSIPTDDLPWASPWKDLNGNVFNVPEVGKIVSVVFENGDVYCPEFIYSEHYNETLQAKLEKLSDDDYVSMKALHFDLETQIYVNKSVGLKIDHKWHNINFTDCGISLNLKEGSSSLNLGDAGASQQVILGNHFMEFFGRLLQAMATPGCFTWAGPAGPNSPGPPIVQLLSEFQAKVDPVFLSAHVRTVDNNQVTTVKNTARSFPESRPNIGALGDLFKQGNKLNDLAKKLKGLKLPQGAKKKKLDAKYKSPQQKNPLLPPSNTTSSPPVSNPQNPDNARPLENGLFQTQNSDATSQDFSKVNPNRVIEYFEEDDDIAKVVRFLESKTGKNPVSGIEEDYQIFEEPYILNIVCFRNRTHEYGTITNRFDDEMWLFFKNEKDEWEDLRRFTITTVPGYKVVDGKKVDPFVLPEGASFINYGQYVNSYKLGYHSSDDYGKRHPALICDKVGIRVNKKRGVFEKERYVNTVTLSQFGPDVDGWIYGGGINIHLAMSPDESLYGTDRFPRAGLVFDEVNSWSMGCIVFNNPEHYREFIGLCEEQRKFGGKSQFTVTVASRREFDIFETAEEFDDTDLTSGDNLNDRFPEIRNEI